MTRGIEPLTRSKGRLDFDSGKRRWAMAAYESYLYYLPVWGDGERGVKTAKVADDLGI